MSGLKNTAKKYLQKKYIQYGKQKVIDEELILVESFQGSEVAGSPLSLLIELCARTSYRVYIVSKARSFKKNNRFLKANSIHAQIVIRFSLKYMRLLATAKYLINNSTFPEFFIRRDEQLYLNTWHGTPYKTLGMSMRKGIESMYNVQRNFLQSSILLFPNHYSMRHMMDDYCLEQLFTGRIVIEGYPRNTVFFNSDRAQVLRKTLKLEDETVFVYMPTWRGKNSYQDVIAYNEQELLQSLDNSLAENERVYVKFHPTVKKKIAFSQYKRILPFPGVIPEYDILNMADALITDYSSVMFDYSITGKPIILLTDDYEMYCREHGVYLDIRELPFLKCADIEEVCQLIRSKKYKACTYIDDEAYHRKFLAYENKYAVEKLIGLLIENKKDGLELADYSKNKLRKWKGIIPEESFPDLESFRGYLRENGGEGTVLFMAREFFTEAISEWLSYAENRRGQQIVVFNKAYFERTDKRLKLSEFIKRDSMRLLPGIELE